MIPDFEGFTADVERFYNLTLPNKSGKNAEYIPQLAKVTPSILVESRDWESNRLIQSNLASPCAPPPGRDTRLAILDLCLATHTPCLCPALVNRTSQLIDRVCQVLHSVLLQATHVLHGAGR